MQKAVQIGWGTVHFLLKLGIELSNTENKITPQVVVTSGVMRLGERSCKIKNGRYWIRTSDPQRVELVFSLN